MNNGHSIFVVFTLLNSLLTPSNSFAATVDTFAISENIEGRVVTSAESAPPFAAESTTASTCPMDEATVDPEFRHLNETEAAVLDWLQNEMQMSIDSSIESQGVTPKYSCIDPPFNCPANQKCPLQSGGNAVCVVTDCGEGKCSFCPANPPFRVVKSWCSYTCMKAGKVVAGAFGFRLAGDVWFGPMCFEG